MKSSSFGVRIYDLPLNRFSNVALPQFLQQLKQHRDNINKHRQSKDWAKLKTEQIKGNQIACQLEAALRELEEVGRQLTPEEEKEFENKIKPYKIQALVAVKDFKNCFEEPRKDVSVNSESEECQHLQQSQVQLLPEEIDVEQQRAQLETYENLQKDMEDLQDLFSEFSQQVHVQGAVVTNIEENVDTALENVKEGQQYLAKAAKFKTTMYPITGALIGTCIGGPVGLLAGLKIGGLAAIGGTILGFASGQGLKKLQETAVNESAASLTKSQSTPAGFGNFSKPESLPPSASFSDSKKHRRCHED